MDAQAFIWSLLLFYVALGTFLVVVGADRIAQSMYDLAQKISHLPYGWMILGAMLGIAYFICDIYILTFFG